MSGTRKKPGYVVFRETSKDMWQLVGEADRQPGRTAREARAEAIKDATGGEPTRGQNYRAVLRSEWAIGAE